MPYRDDKKWEWTKSLCEDGILNRGRKKIIKREALVAELQQVLVKLYNHSAGWGS